MVSSDSRFLIVEDSASMRGLLLMICKQIGYKNVTQSVSGVAAWEELQKPGPAIEVVLCDWMMPEMDGLELLKKIRADEKLSKLPFIMLTAEVEEEKRRLAFDSGVDGFIGKPFSSEQIRTTLAEVFKKLAGG